MNPLLILLIDDDEDSFLITRGLLARVQGASYELQWASSYESGLEKLRKTPYDACLLDYRLGARDGLEVLRQAVAEGCRAPIIMLTGQSDHETDLKAMKAGAADFLDKDKLDASRLERSIRYTVERQQLLEALRKSESQFRRLFEANIIGVFFAETNGRITNANDAFLKMLGYDRVDLPIRWDERLISTDGHILDKPGLEQLQTAGVATPREQKYLHKDGKHVPVLVGAAVLEGHSDHCICFAVDMSERNQLRELVNQSEKLASIGLLSAGIAHEINNPLAYVTNNLAVLRRDVFGLRDLMVLYDQLASELADRFPGHFARIAEIKSDTDWEYVKQNLGRLMDSTQEGLRRIAAIMQNLRAIASKNPGETEVASLSALVDASLETLDPQLVKRGIRVAIEHRPMPPFPCCPTQIVQVFVNLISNSIAAIESANGKEQGVIRILSQRAAEHLMVKVNDNGCGIPPDDLPRIFDPFFTRKPVGAGMGLGLSLSHKIVTDHGGRIEVESWPGKGTSFTVLLPFQPSTNGEPEGKPAAT